MTYIHSDRLPHRQEINSTILSLYAANTKLHQGNNILND